MKETTGLVVPLAVMKAAASSSALPPISPIMMMASVWAHRIRAQHTHRSAQSPPCGHTSNLRNRHSSFPGRCLPSQRNIATAPDGSVPSV